NKLGYRTGHGGGFDPARFEGRRGHIERTIARRARGTGPGSAPGRRDSGGRRASLSIAGRAPPSSDGSPRRRLCAAGGSGRSGPGGLDRRVEGPAQIRGPLVAESLDFSNPGQLRTIPRGSRSAHGATLLV